MKELDFKSIVIAGAIGAGVMVLFFSPSASEAAAAPSSAMSPPIEGFVIGAIVQIGVRLLGVS